MLHPTPDRLEAFVEGTLDDADRAVLESHLVACGECQTEVEELRTLFTTLAALPQFEPSASFAERIIAEVEIRQPWHERVTAALRRLLPTSTVGRTLAVAFLVIPVLTASIPTAWLVSRPWFSLQTMTAFTIEKVAGVFLMARTYVVGLLLENQLGAWVLNGNIALLGELSARDLSATATVGAALIGGSCWILYRNLFRTPTREGHHGTQRV